jgi:adenylate kinase family enzyme
MNVYYIFGCSSVGKTTLINNILKYNKNIIVISADDIWFELRAKEENKYKTNAELKKNNIIENEMIRRIKLNITKNKKIIIDHISIKFMDILKANKINFKSFLLLSSLKNIAENIKTREHKRFAKSIIFELADIMIYKEDGLYKIKYNDLIKYGFTTNEKEMKKFIKNGPNL